MCKRSITFTITADGDGLTLTRSGRKTALASAVVTPSNIAWIYRRLAFYALKAAHYADRNSFNPSPMFFAEELKEQTALLDLECTCLLD